MKTKQYTIEDFNKGQLVNVRALPEDIFGDFTGRVKQVGRKFVIVEDQDGDCFDCEPCQLSACTD